ncbi:hypothetical protein KDA_54840 [Dictyobacter alpinus]|uniref:Transglycosylase n=1 Tax=Dictyobacter alpinus TaxID=2014873 RepID=A0A402BFE6_9CHLR|nr:GlsB/YeaQ/YmgE family stress response membrane protein [Dictyobacter alpinus]GCE30000.1 hypothetical protein KDA_54840 [Dictyobacter alpinus]
MQILFWVIVIVLGALIAGALGLAMPGRGFGFLGDAAIGLIGSILGLFIFGFIAGALIPHMSLGFVGILLFATIGAFIVVAIVHMATKGRTTSTTSM